MAKIIGGMQPHVDDIICSYPAMNTLIPITLVAWTFLMIPLLTTTTWITIVYVETHTFAISLDKNRAS